MALLAHLQFLGRTGFARSFRWRQSLQQAEWAPLESMRAVLRPSPSLINSCAPSASQPRQPTNHIPAFLQCYIQNPYTSAGDLPRLQWRQRCDFLSTFCGDSWGLGPFSSGAGSVIHRGVCTTAAVYRSGEPDGGVIGEPPKSVRPQVAIFWDLDNKTPEQDPRVVADHVRRISEQFGQVAQFRAYANRHTFEHIPSYVREERAERKQLQWEEQQGLSVPDEPYRCGYCGQKFKTTKKLDNHFKQLHERERNKKVNRAQGLRKKKPKASKKLFEALKEKNERYFEAARDIIKPKSGYRLMADLKSRGVRVHLVKDRSQAADDAIIGDLEALLSKPNKVESVVLVSDDSDFARALARIRASQRRVVLIGHRAALQKSADVLLPWWDVHDGSVFREDYRPSPVGSAQSQPSSLETFDDSEEFDDSRDDFESYVDVDDGSIGVDAFDDFDEKYLDDDDPDDEEIDDTEIDDIMFGKVLSEPRSRRR